MQIMCLNFTFGHKLTKCLFKSHVQKVRTTEILVIFFLVTCVVHKITDRYQYAFLNPKIKYVQYVKLAIYLHNKSHRCKNKF